MLCKAVLSLNQRVVGQTHLSTWKGFPLASAMLPSFFMTEACLQGWIEAAGTPEWGKGSTVIVFLACSSLTSSRICCSNLDMSAILRCEYWRVESFGWSACLNPALYGNKSLSSPCSHQIRYGSWQKQCQICTGAYLAGLQGLPVLIIPNQPKSWHLVVLVIGDHQVIGARGNNVIIVRPSACTRSWYSSLQVAGWPLCAHRCFDCRDRAAGSMCKVS